MAVNMALRPDLRAELDEVFGTDAWVDTPDYAETIGQIWSHPKFRCEGPCGATWPIRFQFRTKVHRFCPACAPETAVASEALELDGRLR